MGIMSVALSILPVCLVVFAITIIKGRITAVQDKAIQGIT